jgi:hypothetical protein
MDRYSLNKMNVWGIKKTLNDVIAAAQKQNPNKQLILIPIG